MTRVNTANVNFEFGEISPLAAGRYDLKIGQNGVERCQNFIPLSQGPLRYRNGFVRVHHTRLNRVAKFIEFQFSDSQAYIIEATDLKFRFYKDNGIITEATKTITAITQANPGVVTSAAHGYSNGDEVYIDSVVGMTQLNGRYFIVAGVTANTFQLTDEFAANINTTGYTAYSSAGTAARIYELTTPYAAAHIDDLQYDQNADTMYIAHQSYAPRKLTRSGHTSWTLNTYVRTNDPFTSATDWPRAVCFTSDGRIIFGGTIDNPEGLWASRGPDSATGAPRYDDFTTGTATTHAVYFTLASSTGKTDVIQWLSNTDKFIVAGTFSTLRRIYGNTQEEPISPDSINAKPTDAYGCHFSRPAPNGASLYYIERGARRVRALQYDFQSDGYKSGDLNIVTDHLVAPGIRQIAYQNNLPDCLWVLRDDGVLLSMSNQDEEAKRGWAQHPVGFSGEVISIGVMPRGEAFEQLWICVERTIGANTVRTVEYLEDTVVFPQISDFYDPDLTEAEIKEYYHNARYELAKFSNHLDMSALYDGRAYGVAAAATITPSAVSGSVTLTASAAVFTSAMVGREVWKAYDTTTGRGGGRATITAYTNSTTVTALVISDFNSTAVIPVSSWFLTASSISNLYHLEGETLQIMTDGGVHPEVTVASGVITLEAQASVVILGYSNIGFAKSTNLEFGGTTGPSQYKMRNISQINIRLLDSSELLIGSELSSLERLVLRKGNDVLDRPTNLYSGVETISNIGRWSREKYIYMVQDNPLPLTVLGLDVTGDTTNE